MDIERILKNDFGFGQIVEIRAMPASNSCFLQKQLIHSDVGPGNVIFRDRKVQSIIDFTPEYEHELYSLAQFLYWTCLWDFQEQLSIDRIRSSLKVYFGEQAERYADGSESLFLYLLKACMFRIIGPLLDMIENGGIVERKIERRMLALEKLFQIFQWRGK